MRYILTGLTFPPQEKAIRNLRGINHDDVITRTVYSIYADAVSVVLTGDAEISDGREIGSDESLTGTQY